MIPIRGENGNYIQIVEAKNHRKIEIEIEITMQ